MATAQLKNLSKRADDLQITYLENLLKVRPMTEHGRLPASTSDRAPMSVKGNTVWEPRERAANEALPRDTSAWAMGRYYRTGDGETQLTRRPGSEDHLQYKSSGLGC